jgi:L-alanine-DL-glutamate epimerase-like enolase superfamily enzyme
MPTSPVIERIELTSFTFTIENLVANTQGSSIAYHPGPGTPQKRLAVRVIADTGVIGEYVGNRAATGVLMAHCEYLAYGLIGKPALERDNNYVHLRRATKHMGEFGVGTLDIALWDLAGKHHDASISQLLGGHRKKLKSYASTLRGDEYPDGLSSPEAYADFAEQCLEVGYRGYKMHGWSSGNVQREIAMLSAVGKRVGGRMDLMYDAACHLPTLADAIKIGRICDEFGFYWLEDPYSDGGISIHGHQALKRLIKTPIMINEHSRNPETNTDVLVAGATDFARADPDLDGGVTGCYKIAIAAEGLGIDTEVHACGPSNRQLMAALKLSNYYEINLLHPRCANPWSGPYYADGYADQLDAIDTDGCVPVPQGAGLGITYDWALIERNKVELRIIGK